MKQEGFDTERPLNTERGADQAAGAHGDGRRAYRSPAVESHQPLEIMKAWEDNSSDLQF